MQIILMCTKLCLWQDFFIALKGFQSFQYNIIALEVQDALGSRMEKIQTLLFSAGERLNNSDIHEEHPKKSMPMLLG